MSQLTTRETCEQKRAYRTSPTASRAVKRRNKAAGYKYLRAYKCNLCIFWHVTTQEKEAAPVFEDKSTLESGGEL